ncbi:MAG TPA: response regulator [Tepidisphaeraceae bacterium]|jgi:CheY-like chemotaxis protein
MNADKMVASKAASNKVEEIQDRLDAQADGKASANRERRWPYRRPNINLTVEHPGGGIAKVAAYSRSLWCEGISVLCTGFSYPGSSSMIVLTSKDGGSMSVRGNIVSCRYVEGQFHEVEMKFNQRIDPHLFIEPANGATGETAAPVELQNLRARILHLDDSEADSRLLAYHLRGSGMEFKSVRTTDEALQSLREQVFDIFLSDLNLGKGIDVIPAVRVAREQEFNGPIIILTAETNPAKLAAVEAAGADQIISKPYQPTALVQTLVKLHEQVGALTIGEVIYSTLGDQPEIDELLATYVASVQQIVADLQKAVVARDLTAVRELCLNIKGTAPGYGFAPLGTAAAAAITALDASNAVNGAKPQLRALTLLSGQLALRRNPAPAAKAKIDPNKMV